ncbi:hypothetical protein V500_00054 [Pseudogymnoascus sp. VKM F-4518 (FW-2643)]|nr:hypothetical protein V500_00054 [Pseudogymnoascus sp. VKM F-4518 (FW-2643)]
MGDTLPALRLQGTGNGKDEEDVVEGGGGGVGASALVEALDGDPGGVADAVGGERDVGALRERTNLRKRKSLMGKAGTESAWTSVNLPAIARPAEPMLCHGQLSSCRRVDGTSNGTPVLELAPTGERARGLWHAPLKSPTQSIRPILVEWLDRYLPVREHDKAQPRSPLKSTAGAAATPSKPPTSPPLALPPKKRG